MNKDDLVGSIVIATPKVIEHLEALGFINDDGVDYTDLAIWIGHPDHFSKLRAAHTSDNHYIKYITPDDVLSVPLPKPKKQTVTLELTDEQLTQVKEFLKLGGDK